MKVSKLGFCGAEGGVTKTLWRFLLDPSLQEPEEDEVEEQHPWQGLDDEVGCSQVAGCKYGKAQPGLRLAPFPRQHGTMM